MIAKLIVLASLVGVGGMASGGSPVPLVRSVLDSVGTSSAGVSVVGSPVFRAADGQAMRFERVQKRIVRIIREKLDCVKEARDMGDLHRCFPRPGAGNR